MKKRLLILLSILLSILWMTAHQVAAQSSDQNFILTTTYLKNDQTSSAKIVRYYDGLGRPVQTVQQNAGPVNNNQDLISIQEYDSVGRESKAWLPIYRTANTGTFYAGDIATDAKTQYNDSCANSLPVYEPSPLNRVLQQYGPGQDWRTATRPVKTDYLTNAASDCIYYYMSGDNLAQKGYYDAGTLYVTKTADEDNKVSFEFKDKLGRVVLQRQMDGTDKFDTYYVYDDFGNLRWVLPPMFESIADMQESCNDYGYYYRYDERNRCVEKKLPGVDPIYYVYDRADRLIFSQDGEQRMKSDWTFNKYDALGRLILTGIWKNSGKTQAALNSLYKNTLVTETYSNTGTYNYTWNTLTEILGNQGANNSNITSLSGGAGSIVLQVNYYDNYLFKSDSPYFDANYNYTTPYGFDNQRYGTDTDDGKSKGLLTGTITMMLTNFGTICSVFYYDNKGQVIQSIASNHVGGYEKEYTNYSFTGKPTWKQMIHTSDYLGDDNNITETYTYDYDHADRPTITKYKLDADPEFALSTLSYDNQGRLASKNQSEYAITTTYSYNIRNRITNIRADLFWNNEDVSWNTVIVPKAFDETLYYNESYANNTPQYNGNISAVSWKHFVGSDIKGYLYSYDGLNRLKKGQFLYGTTPDNTFNEEVTQYDKNGNIQKMKRYARISMPDNADVTDDLTLNYRGNQIVSITDAIPASVSTIGFVPPVPNVGSLLPTTLLDPAIPSDGGINWYFPIPIDDPVTYNRNGAIKHNFYSGIDEIAYNVLNLPDNIRFMDGHNIRYNYDAAGEKHGVVYQSVESNINIPLGKTGYKPNASDDESALTADYCAGGHIVYENGELKRILNPEGYVIKLSDGTNSYNYYAKDHLGNNRAVFAAATTTFLGPRQEISYYPFGMPYTQVGGRQDGVWPEQQPYKFGGKEYDEMYGLNWYDFNARYYNGIVPGFMTPDPLAELTPDISPYAYCENNPVNAVDPTGMFTTKIGAWIYKIFHGGGDILRDKGGEYFVSTQKNYSDEEGITVEAKRTFDWKGRTEGKDLNFENAKEEYMEKMQRQDFYSSLERAGAEITYTDNPREAAWSWLKLGINTMMPNMLKAGTGIVNAAKMGTRIKANSLKELKTLINQLSRPDSELTAKELGQLKKLVQQFGGKLRYDFNPIKGKILKPHVQVEGLGSSVEARHIWLGQGVK